ncbi:MAG: 16S rRNA (cytosine(1402)-N(4))-methyltransferase RsmH [Thermodesulfobacteriota bacterium]
MAVASDPAEQPPHVTVLLHEAVELLQVRDGGLYVDGNLGFGGHSSEILALGGQVIGFDWDDLALAQAEKRLARWSDKVRLVRRNFAELSQVLAEEGVAAVDGILLDLGLSSMQLADEERGFSFQGDQPLDMRMDSRLLTSGADLVNSASQEELADILYYYGEERQARPIAAAIIARRQKAGAITSTAELVEVIKSAVPRRYYPKKIHVATRSFQALRIAVNQELDNLATILREGPALLKPGGRLVIISFHSLEDRLVKKKFRDEKLLQVVTRKPLLPSAAECSRNPRARSARLRAAERRAE